ncbi:MAG: crossover junction endodeoxyribonuclease RuvC [Caldilineaceae bacterium]
MTLPGSALEYVVLGIDPGTATTGYGVVAQTTRGDYTMLACGVIRTLPTVEMPLRLREIYEDIQNLIREFQPNEVAVEKLFFGRNVTNAISVGQARGVVLVAAALCNLNVVEYTRAEVKQSISGYGNADKRQMQEMVQRTLDLPEPPRPDDAADGIAIALCHLQTIAYRRLVGA